MSYLYETHLHTLESSRCGHTPAREYVPFYLDHGYRGIVVTDHFSGNPSYMPDRDSPWRDQVDVYCRGYEEAREEGDKRGLQVFFGIEQKFDDDECLIYGVDKQWMLKHPDLPTWGRARMLSEVEAAGGCIVLAHPFRSRGYVSQITLNACVHAIEAFNANNKPRDDLYGLAYAKYLHLPITAGSDMHDICKDRPFGLYGVAFNEPWKDIFDYVRAIRTNAPFAARHDAGRGEGEREALDKPYVRLDRNDQPTPWQVDEIFRS